MLQETLPSIIVCTPTLFASRPGHRMFSFYRSSHQILHTSVSLLDSSRESNVRARARENAGRR